MDLHLLKLKVVIAMSNIQKYINDIIDKKLKTATILKHVRGEIVSIDENNEYAGVNVNGKTLNLINKSNEELSVGDEVTIHYWTNIGNGWIALRHGLTTLNSNRLAIQDAVVLNDKQAAALTVGTETIDNYKNLSVKYGADENCILLNGYVVYPISVLESSLLNKDTDYQQMVKKANINYQTLTVDELKEDNSIKQETYHEEFIQKEWDGSNWHRYTACVQETTKKVVMPEYIWKYSGDGSLKLFFTAIYAPSSVGKARYFEHGCADIVLVRDMVNAAYTPEYIVFTAGFKSTAEYEYALTVATRSLVEEA